MKPAVLGVVLSAAVACRAAGEDGITNGMPRSDLIRLAGQPRATIKVGDEETLSFPSGGRVVLRTGRVVSWSLALPPARTAPQPEARPPDRPAAAAAAPAAAPVASEDGWLTSYSQALDQAKQQKRHLLLDFTGSDWCGYCIRLDNDVFRSAAFREFAAAQFVCVRLDFPRKHPITDELRRQNQELAAKHAVRGYPTVILLATDGTLVGRLAGYDGSGAPAYIARIRAALDDYAKQHPAP